MATPYRQSCLIAVLVLLALPLGCGNGSPATEKADAAADSPQAESQQPEPKVLDQRVPQAGNSGKEFWLSRNSIKSNEQITLSLGQPSEEGAGGPSRTFDQNFARAVIGRKLERGEQLFVHDFKVEFSAAAGGRASQGVDLDAKDDRKGIWLVDDSGGSIAMNYKAEKLSSHDRAAHRSPWRSVNIDRNLVTLVIGRNLNRDESAFAYEPKTESGRKASAHFEASVPTVTARTLQMFGPKYKGEMVQMTGCTFVEVNDTFSPLPNLCGFFVKDSNQDFFVFALAQRDDAGQLLLGLKRGDPISLLGSVIQLDDRLDTYNPGGLVVTKQGDRIRLPRYWYAITGCKVKR
jgi:hypothetical protein